MKISCLGASQTVTGSCFVIETSRARFAVDCGLHQGNAEIDKRNLDMAPYDPANLDFVLVTHAHMDHAGLLPRLVKFGFSGPIYTTVPTRDLLEIMLADSAHIQEMEAQWRNKKRKRRAEDMVDPLYDQADAAAAHALIRDVEYRKAFSPSQGVEVVFSNAGHILGSALIQVRVVDNGESFQLAFSGDLGRPNQLLVADPSTIDHADYLFLESTYGDRDHKNETQSLDELAEAIAYSHANGEKVIIPSFAVERSQEILYSLYMLKKDGRLPPDMPVFLDSPLAIKATRIFSRHPEYLDPPTRKLMESGENPFEMDNLHFTVDTQDSINLHSLGRPAVVISASGMCTAGRIRHHLRNNLWKPGASIVFVGFQARGTPGRKIVEGAKSLSILGDTVAVKAKVFTIGGFSAHAGQTQIMEWLGGVAHPDLKVFLVHGESRAQETLAGLIADKLHLAVHIPAYQEEITLEPGAEPRVAVDAETAAPSVNWDYLLADTEQALADFKAQVSAMRAKPWVDQTELRDQLLDVTKHLRQIVSEI
jgi:metallo-beta-lactamase family protein